MLCMPSEICFCPTEHRLYRENLQSLTYQPKKNLMRNWILIASDFEQFLKEKHLSREYGDLISFICSLVQCILPKEEMTYQGKKIRVAAKILKQYSRNPFVEQKLTLKECIRYTRQIKSLFWKLLAFTLVLFIQMHMYFVVAAVFVWMSSLGIDSL